MPCPHNAHRGRIPRATWLPALLVWLLPLVGCGPLFLGSPEIHRFHAIDVVAPGTQVRAFRIDVEHGDPETGFPGASLSASEGNHADNWQLAAVAIPEDGRIPAKTFVTWHRRKAFEHWKRASGDPLSDRLRHEPDTRLRLYRPGFETIEIRPWHKTDRLRWMPATDLAAREKAIDDLLCTTDTEGSREVSSDIEGRASELLLGPWEDALGSVSDRRSRNLPRDERLWPLAFGHLRPGTASEDHRRALEFAAFEYERLADQEFSEGPQPDKIRARIRKKSVWLGELAAGKKPRDPPQPSSLIISASNSIGSPTTFDSLPLTTWTQPKRSW